MALTPTQEAVLSAIYTETARRGWSARELIALSIAESQLGKLLRNDGDSAWGSYGPFHQNLMFCPEARARFPDWRWDQPAPLPRDDPWVEALRQKYMTDHEHAAKVAADRFALFREGGYGRTWTPNTEYGTVSTCCLYNGGSNPDVSPVRWLYTIGWQQAQAYPESRETEDEDMATLNELQARVAELEAEKVRLVESRGYLHGDVAVAFRKEIETMRDRLNAAQNALAAFESAVETLERETAPL